MSTRFNLPPGCSHREIEDPAPSSEAEQCNGTGCDVMVEPDDPYYATPCGTFCEDCIGEHFHKCQVCEQQLR